MSDDDSERRDESPRPPHAPPKKKGGISTGVALLVVIMVLGVAGVGGYVGVSAWSASQVKNGQAAAEGTLSKIGNGDLTGAYNSMSAGYKSTHPQAQFEKTVKDAQLTDYTGVTWDDKSTTTQQEIWTFVGNASLKSGGNTKVMVTVRMLEDRRSYSIEDIGGASFAMPQGGGTTMPRP